MYIYDVRYSSESQFAAWTIAQHLSSFPLFVQKIREAATQYAAHEYFPKQVKINIKRIIEYFESPKTPTSTESSAIVKMWRTLTSLHGQLPFSISEFD